MYEGLVPHCTYIITKYGDYIVYIEHFLEHTITSNSYHKNVSNRNYQTKIFKQT